MNLECILEWYQIDDILGILFGYGCRILISGSRVVLLGRGWWLRPLPKLTPNVALNVGGSSGLVR